MHFAELDAVTIDGYGTLIGLEDPVPVLCRALAVRGLERDPELVAAAFREEVAYYRPRSLEGRDDETLAALRRDCTGVFLAAAEANVEPAAFVDEFMSALVFRPEPGAVEVIRMLRARGLDLAVVSNWDVGLDAHLERAGLAAAFSTVVTSAEAGAAKPDPAPFRLALDRLGVEPARALHVGDEPDDERGALAAGMRFASAPLAGAFEGWS